MNKKYIADELNKRGVPFAFFWHKDEGPALRFTYIDGGLKYWNALLPIDDESDPKFVDFVEANYKRIHPAAS